MPDVRRLLRLAPLAALAVALAAAPVARAEGEDAEHGRDLMALTSESLPSGWTLLPEDAAPATDGAKALVAAVAAASKEAAVPDTERELLVQALRTPAGPATVVLLDVFVDPAKLLAALRAAAEKGGFTVVEMASPARLALVAAPAEVREEVVAVQRRAAARQIAEAAIASLESRDGERAADLAKTSLSFEPGAALPRLALGIAGSSGWTESEAARTKSIAEIEASLAPAAAPPLSPRLRAVALRHLGAVLLYVKTPEADAKGRDALKRALEEPGAKEVSKDETAGWRYDLACAHARLRELDPAFAALRAALVQDKESPLRGIAHWREDPDFTNLKADPRWAEILKEFGAAAPHGEEK